ncbi:hypothetical protein [Nocardioides sp.]|uniref:hypothetical protein n=1 Tax=Nocardioides sp. TaxID=35761 RepID=UPI002C98EF6A|nr:hypothetical protein [Nocardioides sp.]HSX68446.1 hypothetical protein [Nocardioides sp.]
MSKMLGPMSGRFTEHVLTYPLGTVDDDGIWTPDYYGQTVALARHLDGELYDLAGGCMGVVRPAGADAPEGAVWEVYAYSPDIAEVGDCTIARWYMSEHDDLTEPVVLPGVTAFCDDEEDAEEWPTCETCGEPIDYCLGHGVI